MIRKNKNAFTLVELLAVIVILAVILVIAVPKIVTVIDDAKKATLESSAKMVASEAEKRKVQNQVLGKDENITCETVSRLNDIDYENCYIEFLNNQAYVTIIGSNKFEDMYICKGTKNESKVVDRCPNERVSVTIDPAGGIVTDLSGIYKEGDIIELENPSKENATFINWNVVKGSSTLSDNKLTVGSEDTIVWAEYEEWGELIIDLDGGSVSNNQSGKYKSNTTIELEVPLKENHKFIEWEKIEGNGIVSGTTFTMGSLNTKIKAKWELNVFKLNVELNGGTISKDYSGNYEVGSTITIENPTKAGYTFSGWIVTGTGASINDNILTMGTDETTVIANWKIPEPVDFETDSWSTIVRTVQSGNHPYEVGNTKTVDMGSIGVHTIRVANTTKCSEVTVESKTACGFVLEFADVITKYYMNPAGEYYGTQYDYGTNLGGWPASALRKYLNDIDTTSEEDGVIYNALPEELRNGIINTYVVSSHGSGDTTGELENDNFGSTDKLYLLSPQEVYGTSFSDQYETSNGTSRQLDYYADYKGEDSSGNEYTGVSITNYGGAIKQNAGRAYDWWFRSAGSNSDRRFYRVNYIGNWNSSNAHGSSSVSPAFRLAE